MPHDERGNRRTPCPPDGFELIERKDGDGWATEHYIPEAHDDDCGSVDAYYLKTNMGRLIGVKDIKPSANGGEEWHLLIRKQYVPNRALNGALTRQRLRILQAYRKARQQRIVDHDVQVQKPPGYHLDHCLQVLFSRRTYRRVFSQIVVDMRIEYIEALSKRELRTARWVVIRCYWSVVWAWLIQLPTGVVAEVIKRLSGP